MGLRGHEKSNAWEQKAAVAATSQPVAIGDPAAPRSNQIEAALFSEGQ
jgi:hypothetical protein